VQQQEKVAMRVVRSVFAIVCGLFILSVVAEGIEFAIVTALHGSLTDDPQVYLTIRNRPPILAAKLAYNTAAAVLAGYATGWIAGRAPLVHGAILAIIQLSFFVWGMLFSQYAGTTPAWAWITLVPLMGAGICLGTFIQARRRA
jgi:hypothetical protein